MKIQVNKDLILNSQNEARMLAVSPGPVIQGGMLETAIDNIKKESLRNNIELQDKDIINMIAKAELK